MNTSFITSYLTFYLKGSVNYDRNFVRVSQPNTILKLIPLGLQTQDYPVEQISSVSTTFKVAFGSLVWGAICVLLGLESFGSSFFLALLLMAYGALTVLSSLQSAVCITVAGQTRLISLIVFEQDKAQEIANRINEMLSNRYADTNVRIHTEASTDRIVDAINNAR